MIARAWPLWRTKTLYQSFLVDKSPKSLKTGLGDDVQRAAPRNEHACSGWRSCLKPLNLLNATEKLARSAAMEPIPFSRMSKGKLFRVVLPSETPKCSGRIAMISMEIAAVIRPD